MGLLKKLLGQEDRLEGVELDLKEFFRLDKEIGRGTFSVVYKVQRISDGQWYALKLIETATLSSEDQRAALEEIRLLSSLRHPNLVRYYEAFVDHRRLCVVMELVRSKNRGGDLATLLRKRLVNEDPLSEKEYLHRHHVLHRDMKPQNLLLGDDGVLRISDLGVSQELTAVFSRLNVGTPQYMSPEMHRHEPYSYSADLWSLGCILHELCTLRPLFFDPERTKTEADVRDLVLSGKVPVLPGRYSAPLRQLASLLLHPYAAHRPTIDEVIEMPSVQERMSCLPAQLRAALQHAAALEAAEEPSHHGRVALGAPIPLPAGRGADLDVLNALLPPAQYETGEGVAPALARKCRSTGDLVRLQQQAQGRQLGVQQQQQQQQQQRQQQSAAARLAAGGAAPAAGFGPGSTALPFAIPGGAPAAGPGGLGMPPRHPSTGGLAPPAGGPRKSSSLTDLLGRSAAGLQRHSVMAGEVLYLHSRGREEGGAEPGARGGGGGGGGGARPSPSRAPSSASLASSGASERGGLRRNSISVADLSLHHGVRSEAEREAEYQARHQLPEVGELERRPFEFLAAAGGGSRRGSAANLQALAPPAAAALAPAAAAAAAPAPAAAAAAAPAPAAAAAEALRTQLPAAVAQTADAAALTSTSVVSVEKSKGKEKEEKKKHGRMWRFFHQSGGGMHQD